MPANSRRFLMTRLAASLTSLGCPQAGAAGQAAALPGAAATSGHAASDPAPAASTAGTGTDG